MESNSSQLRPHSTGPSASHCYAGFSPEFVNMMMERDEARAEQNRPSISQSHHNLSQNRSGNRNRTNDDVQRRTSSADPQRRTGILVNTLKPSLKNNITQFAKPNANDLMNFL